MKKTKTNSVPAARPEGAESSTPGAQAAGVEAAAPETASEITSDQPADSPDPASASEPEAEIVAATAPSADALAEAEQRGYLRGRNERIEELMREPGSFERSRTAIPADNPEGDAPAADPMILSRRKMSIWDL